LIFPVKEPVNTNRDCAAQHAAGGWVLSSRDFFWLGKLIEFDKSGEIFTKPSDKTTGRRLHYG